MELFGGINQAAFNRVIDAMEDIYEPIVKAHGGILKINRLWSDGTVNASAQRQGKNWIVNMYGGLARHSVVTEDGFALVLCHELGHQIGGYPKIMESDGRTDWASNEGQADYFATMKCFRRVYEDADNATAISSLSIPNIVKNKCSDTFKSTPEINLCIREAMAGGNLALLLWTLSNGGRTTTAAKPAFDTPDSREVDETNDAHPAAQCRMDTYFNGSICAAAHSDDFGDKDPVTGSCAMEKGDKIGYRPLCWYKPQN